MTSSESFPMTNQRKTQLEKTHPLQYSLRQRLLGLKRTLCNVFFLKRENDKNHFNHIIYHVISISGKTPSKF